MKPKSESSLNNCTQECASNSFLKKIIIKKRQKLGLFTRLLVHQKEHIRSTSYHSKEFHHSRRSEGTPRTHLLTGEPLQGNLWQNIEDKKLGFHLADF